MYIHTWGHNLQRYNYIVKAQSKCSHGSVLHITGDKYIIKKNITTRTFFDGCILVQFLFNSYIPSTHQL